MMTSLINRRTTAFLATIIFACCFQVLGLVRAEAQDFEIPQPTGNAVNDFAGVMDAQSKQQLETILINLKKEQQIEFAVVTIRTTGGRDIFDYALAISRQWGIGPSQDQKQGLLLLVAIDDGRYQTMVSRHLQGELTDGTVGSLQRQYLIPAFRAKRYGEGLLATTRAYIDTLAEKRGFSTAGIYQQTDKRTSQPPPRRANRKSGISTCGTIIIIAIVLLVLLSSRGRGGGGGSGCLNMLLLGSLLNSGGRGGWSSGDWGGGGGFGGSSGGDGGGFGGFGGGGDFDGGGAGGSWE